MAKDTPTLIDEAADESALEQAKEAAAAAPAPTREELYIRFNSGDTLDAIAEKYDTTPERIIERNNVNPAALQVGHWLYV